MSQGWGASKRKSLGGAGIGVCVGEKEMAGLGKTESFYSNNEVVSNCGRWGGLIPWGRRRWSLVSNQVRTLGLPSSQGETFVPQKAKSEKWHLIFKASGLVYATYLDGTAINLAGDFAAIS